MDEGRGGWRDGWKDDGWRDEWVGRWMGDGWMNGWGMDEWMDEGEMGGWVDGGRDDGWRDGPQLKPFLGFVSRHQTGAAVVCPSTLKLRPQMM